jgi:N-acetylmuramoyl-L-alanine amidase
VIFYTVTAGHGGKDPGAVAADGTTEAALMTELRDAVAHKLKIKGYGVRTDGGWRANLPLPYAITLVPGSKVAIELHTNAASHPGATGVEVVALPAQAPMARRIARLIANALGMRVRGDGGWIDQNQTARGRLGFVRAGGLVVEVFFISNPKDLETYRARVWLVAEAIAVALTSQTGDGHGV